jgi:DNA invertase Pin-like site-specific DNA recombinase
MGWKSAKDRDESVGEIDSMTMSAPTIIKDGHTRIITHLGRLTFQVLGAVAEFEREMLRERVKAGMNQARRVGTHIGRPPRRRLGQAQIEKIGLLRSQGKNVRQLAKEYGASQWMIARLEPAS